MIPENLRMISAILHLLAIHQLKKFHCTCFFKNGMALRGKIKVCNPILKKEDLAEICNPIFVDPNGDRLRE